MLIYCIFFSSFLVRPRHLDLAARPRTERPRYTFLRTKCTIIKVFYLRIRGQTRIYESDVQIILLPVDNRDYVHGVPMIRIILSDTECSTRNPLTPSVWGHLTYLRRYTPRRDFTISLIGR